MELLNIFYRRFINILTVQQQNNNFEKKIKNENNALTQFNERILICDENMQKVEKTEITLKPTSCQVGILLTGLEILIL